MATRRGLCGAGKIRHDFSVAMETLPPGDHQIAVIASRSTAHAKDMVFLRLLVATRSRPMTQKLAIWSRCFPVYAEVCRLLAEEALGEVKLVKASFGSPQLDVPQLV